MSLDTVKKKLHQVTLAALYGEKSNSFRDLIEWVWAEMEQSALKGLFKRYEINQVHATIIGMENVPGHAELYNRVIYEKENGLKQKMNFHNFHANVVSCLPLTIQLGGFPEKFEACKSQGEKLYNRSFTIQWDSERVVLIGWPVDVESGSPHDGLWELRQNVLHKNGIRHKFHRDNDFYMVIAHMGSSHHDLSQSVDERKQISIEIEEKVRRHLESHPLQLQISEKELFLVRYQTRTLALDSSTSWNLSNVRKDPDFISSLYT